MMLFFLLATDILVALPPAPAPPRPAGAAA